MGECGCASNFGHFKLPAKSGWYVFDLYPGCEACGTPMGFIIEHCAIDEKSIEDVPDIHKMISTGECSISIPLFELSDLIDSEEIQDMGPPDEYETFQEAVRDMKYPIIQATITTINRFLDRLNKERHGKCNTY